MRTQGLILIAAIAVLGLAQVADASMSKRSGARRTTSNASVATSTAAAAPSTATAGSTAAAAPAGSSSTATSQSSATSSGSSSGGSTSGGSNTPATFDQFKAAIAAYSKTTAGGTPEAPSQEMYDDYVEYIGNVFTLNEQAQILANFVWESVGLTVVEEVACSDGSCSYGNFYGRGYVQLTWDYNYQSASTSIYGDSSLYDNPSIAAETEGAWKTAAWYWKTFLQCLDSSGQVSSTCNDSGKQPIGSAPDNFELGYSVKNINGIECPANQNAQNRLTIYQQIVTDWGINTNGKTPSLTGC